MHGNLEKSHKTIVASDMDCRCKKSQKIWFHPLTYLWFYPAIYHVTNLVIETTNDVLPCGNILNIKVLKYPHHSFWMVLVYDTWQNNIFPHGILIVSILRPIIWCHMA
jgi:hypothetical protein